MARLVLASAVALALVAGCAAAGPPVPAREVKARAAAYTNPVYKNPYGFPREASDPMALKYNGEYYAYVTGEQCGVLRSEDLVKWQYGGAMLGDVASCWAPDVTYKNGTFYAYVSTLRWGETETDRRVRLYTSQSPTGPFGYVADVTDHYSYDGHYFRDEDGQEYLYWTRECALSGISPCSGNPTLVDRLTDLQTLAGRPGRVSSPTDWECRGRCILEAPQVQKRDGQYYLLYSGAAYEDDSYGAGYAVARVPDAPSGLAGYSTWVKRDQVLKSLPGQVSGPGGASWVKPPNNLEYGLVNHGGMGDARGGPGRWLFLDPVVWGGDRLWLPGAPSTGAEVGPALPSFRDLFNRPDQDGLGPDWATEGGAWSIANGQARQAGTSGRSRALAGQPAAAYRLEANVRAGQGSTGRAGVYAYYADEQNYALALLDPQARSLTIQAAVAGAEQPAHAFPLPGGFAFDAYHQMLVTKNAERFRFQVDGLPLGTVTLAFPAPGRVGLMTEGAAADFDGVAFAHGWEDFFDGTAAGWGGSVAGTRPSGDWSVRDGALVQSAEQGRHQVFKGSREWGSYAFTVSLKLLAGGKQARYGVFAAYYDAANYVEALIDPSARTLITRAVVNGKPEQAESAPLQERLASAPDFWVYHTLRVVKNGYSFTFYLDGEPFQQRTVQVAQGQPGLLSDNARVQYAALLAVRWD